MLIPLHGIASRHDLPLPFSFVLVGGAAALLVSFVVLIFAWRRAPLPGPGGRDLSRLTVALDRPTVPVDRSAPGARPLRRGWGSRSLGGVDRLTNPVFGFVFVWMWVGLIPVSLLLGRFWRATNPLRTLHLGLCRLARVDPRDGDSDSPARPGRLAGGARGLRLRLARAGAAGSDDPGGASAVGVGLAGHPHRGGGRVRVRAGSGRRMSSRRTPRPSVSSPRCSGATLVSAWSTRWPR